ncbi:MAG: T9SS type A sorting domain-containing protein [Cryomorphaceae bacterium]
MKQHSPASLSTSTPHAGIYFVFCLAAFILGLGARAQEAVISMPVYTSGAVMSLHNVNLSLSEGAELPGDGTWKFSGNTPLTLSNTAGSDAGFPNVLIRTSESLTLMEGDMFVNGDFFFSFGTVQTDDNHVVFGKESLASGARNFSYVDGNVIKEGGKDFVFPVGGNGRYQPVEMFDLSGENSVFQASYSANSHPDPEGPWFDGNNWPVSTCDFWSLNRISGSDDADVRLGWEGSDCNEVNDPDYMRVARYAEGAWELIDSAPDGGGETVGTISGTGLFGDFALASIGGGINVLPIELIEFTARPLESGEVLTNWATASETNNDYFTIQRSADALHWEDAGEVIGAGFSNAELNYSFRDVSPIPGQSYYRLRQTDFDGQSELSDVKSVYTNSPTGSFSLDQVYMGESGLNFRYTAEGPDIVAEVYDLLGKKVHTATVQSDQSLAQIYPNLTRGIYILRISQGDRSDSMRFFR